MVDIVSDIRKLNDISVNAKSSGFYMRDMKFRDMVDEMRDG